MYNLNDDSVASTLTTNSLSSEDKKRLQGLHQQKSHEIQRSLLDVLNGQDIEKQPQQELEPPNGGYSWVIALAALLATFATWGANASFGIFLDFYMQHGEFPGATKIDYALIGGTVMFLAQVCAPISSFLSRVLGPQWVIAIGCVIQTVGYILASFSTKFWQIYMTQGVMIGFSFLMIFIPATMVLSTWFTTRKATSMGIAISGVGLGGLVFSLSAGALIQRTGDQKWALRMMGCVAFVSVMIALIALKPFNVKRKPLAETITKEYIVTGLRQSLDLAPFYKKYEFAVLASWFSFCQLGYVLLLFTIAPYASSIGLSSSQVLNANSVFNAALCVGRPLMGLFADKFGRFNASAGLSLMVLIVLYAFWINANTYGTMIAFSCLTGLISGVGITMALSLASDLVEDQSDYTLEVVWGGINVINSPFCLVAGVISLALTKDNVPRPYLHSQIFSGTCFLYTFLSMMVLREWAVRKSLKRELQLLIKLQIEEDDQDLHKKELKIESLLKMTPLKYFIRMFHFSKV